MKLFLKVIGLLVLLLALVMVAQIIASESGEVVVVTVSGDGAEPRETRLWVVDHDGDAWLRAGSEQAGWYQRMRQAPIVQVVRGEEQFVATVMPQVDMRNAINERMAAKYGWADAFIAFLYGREDSVPLRLQRGG